MNKVQDEREAFDLFPEQLEALAERIKQYREAHKDDVCSPKEVLHQCHAWAGSDQYHGTGTGDSFQRAADLIEALLAARPAQTEQQPDDEPDPFGLIYRIDGEAVIQLVGDPHIADGMAVYAAPIAQTAPQTAAKMPCGATVTNVYEAYEAGKKAAPQPEQSGPLTALLERASKSVRSHISSLEGAMQTSARPEAYRRVIAERSQLLVEIDAALSAQRGEA